MHSGLYNALEALLRRCDEVESATVLGRMSLSDAAYLAAIQRSGRRGGVSGVARLIGVSQPTATEAIFNLERKGYAHRIVQKGARSHAILLTQEGATMLLALINSEEEVIRSVLSMLDEQERGHFVGLLTEALVLGAKERAEMEFGPAQALVAGLMSRKYSSATATTVATTPIASVAREVGGAAEDSQRSSAPSLASATWNTQAVAEAAAPLMTKTSSASSRGDDTFVLVHRERPRRQNVPPTQNPKHIGQETK